LSNFITIKHSMPCGDLLSLMPSFKHIFETTGRKSIIYQRVGLQYGDMYGAYPGAVYSIKDEAGVPVTMNKATFEALSPLLCYQDYIHDFREWKGEQVDYDFDLLRQMDTTMPYGSINRWPWYVWPEMACDLSAPWLNKMGVFRKEKILINRTQRYNNMLISYSFLKKYENDVVFIGLPEEYNLFCEQNRLNINHFHADHFHEIALAMDHCKMFLGNQSACFQIAEGLKIPRILEVCKQIPNVIGSGAGFYDFINQRSLEYYVDKLYNS
jgi:hypothetical protein